MNKSIPEAVVEAVARAICAACEENPDRRGDARGNKFRWQDYRDVALAAISALAAQAQPKRRRYDPSASLSEYGIFPECDAAPAAQAPRACTCHPDDRPDGPCRERYAASECQALAAAPQQTASVDEVKETDLWRCTVCGRVGTVGRCCGEETRERLLADAASAERAETAEGRESKCPWGGCGDCVGHEVTQPAGDGARVTDAERHDMERKARELLAVEYERRRSRRMAEGIRSTPAAEFGDRDLGCAVRAIVAALAAREGDGARVTEADRELRERAGQMILRLGQFALFQRRRRYPKNAELAAECAELLAAFAAREGGAK